MKAVTDGEYATGLALVSRRELAETRLADYAKLLPGNGAAGSVALRRSRCRVDAVSGELQDGALKDTAVEARRGHDRASRSRTRRAVSSHDHGGCEGCVRRLLDAPRPGGGSFDHRDHAIEAYRKVYYGFRSVGERLTRRRDSIDCKQSERVDQLAMSSHAPNVCLREDVGRSARGVRAAPFDCLG